MKFWFSTEPGDFYPLTYTVLWFEWRLWNRCRRLPSRQRGTARGDALLVWAHRPSAMPTPWLIGCYSRCIRWPSNRSRGSVNPKTLLEHSSAWRRRRLALLQRRPRAAWICFVLSPAGKPVLIALPILVFAAEWGRAGPRRALDAALPGLALSLVFGVIGVWFQSVRTIGSDFARTETVAQRAAIAGHAFWFYIEKAVVPRDLLFVYPRWNFDYSQAATFLPLVGVIGLTALVWVFRERLGQSLLLAWAWVLCALPLGCGCIFLALVSSPTTISIRRCRRCWPSFSSCCFA